MNRPHEMPIQPANGPSPVTKRLSAALMCVQTVLLVSGAFWNSVTFDEVNHLPAGISYWHQGQYWCYHHNPPFIKLLFAMPAVMMDVPTDYSHFRYLPGNRGPDFELGNDFLRVNRNHYELLYAICRLVVVAMTVWAGWLVFTWSSLLFNEHAGLLSQALWTVCPNVLAHGCLVTPDIGATILGFYATYRFWSYLNAPSAWNAAVCGVLLGLTESSKFSYVVLPGIWLAILLVRLMTEPGFFTNRYVSFNQIVADVFVVVSVSLLALNLTFLFEGTGAPLGELKFFSRTLTRPADSSDQFRVNRFQGTFAGRIPMPFPEQYLLGFDDQLRDVDGHQMQNYLRGEIRRGKGWWHYYLYCLLVKTPVGSMAIGVVSLIAWICRWRNPRTWFNDATLVIPIAVFLVVISANDGINSHIRYILPIFPFAMVFAGGSLALFARVPGHPRILQGLLLASFVSIARVHPYQISYFNEIAGGPRQGFQHVVDSNLDWGHGLIALRRWLKQNAPDRPVQLAYFGGLHPESLGLSYDVPGVLNSNGAPDSVGGLRPGLHVISANYIAGLDFPPPNGHEGRQPIPPRAYIFYRRLKPIAVVAHCLHIYDVTAEDIQKLQRGD